MGLPREEQGAAEAADEAHGQSRGLAPRLFGQDPIAEAVELGDPTEDEHHQDQGDQRELHGALAAVVARKTAADAGPKRPRRSLRAREVPRDSIGPTQSATPHEGDRARLTAEGGAIRLGGRVGTQTWRGS